MQPGLLGNRKKFCGDGKTPIPKVGKDHMKNNKPISLIYTDAQVLNKVLANIT